MRMTALTDVTVKMMFKEMSYDEWFDTYKPIRNNLDKHASFDGYMFETYEEELDFVIEQDEFNIWTYCEGDRGMYIFNGYRLVNRIGYFITEVPFENDDEIQITIEEYSDELDTTESI